MTQGRADLILKPLGPISIDFRDLRPAAPRSAEDCVFTVTEAGLSGRITLDARLALRVVTDTLGGLPSRLVRPLAPLERGVLGAQLGHALRELGSRACLHLSPPVGEPAPGTLAFDIALDALGSPTTVRLDAPRPLLPPALAAARPDERGRLVATAVAELGRTDLSQVDLAAARAGDLIVFGAPPSLCVRIGPSRASARMADGGIALSGPLEFDAGWDPAAAGETQILPASSTELTAESGRLVLAGGELLDVSAGRVLPFPSSAAVELTIRGRPWARGERADVDGELAIRLGTIYR